MSNVQNNDNKKENRMYQLTAEIKSILLKRKAPEIRILTYEFFKKIYSSIEQEMLSEGDLNSTACRDPYVGKLLEKLIVSQQRETVNSIIMQSLLYFRSRAKDVKTSTHMNSKELKCYQR